MIYGHKAKLNLYIILKKKRANSEPEQRWRIDVAARAFYAASDAYGHSILFVKLQRTITIIKK